MFMAAAGKDGIGQLLVRAAARKDVPVLLDLQKDAFGDDPHCLTREGFEAFIGSRRIDVIVAAHAGEVVGYAVMNNRPFRPWTALDYIAVSSARRSGRIGEVLLREALALARRRSVRLFVRPSNERAIAFYLRHGFSRIGLRRKNYADGEDAVIMARRFS